MHAKQISAVSKGKPQKSLTIICRRQYASWALAFKHVMSMSVIGRYLAEAYEGAHSQDHLVECFPVVQSRQAETFSEPMAG